MRRRRCPRVCLPPEPDLLVRAVAIGFPPWFAAPTKECQGGAGRSPIGTAHQQRSLAPIGPIRYWPDRQWARSDNLGVNLGGQLRRIAESGLYMCTITEGLIARMTASAQHCRSHRAYARRCDDGELTCHHVRAIDLADQNVRIAGHLDILRAAKSTVR